MATRSNHSSRPEPSRLSHFRRGLLIAAGIVSVGLAALGVFLPLLPTTPFLLLAAACFLRGSDRLHRWLLGHRLFGRYIRHYREDHAIPLRSKIFTLVLLWSTILTSALLVARQTWLRIALLLIAAGVTLHLLRMKTLPPPPDR